MMDHASAVDPDATIKPPIVTQFGAEMGGQVEMALSFGPKLTVQPTGDNAGFEVLIEHEDGVAVLGFTLVFDARIKAHLTNIAFDG